MPARTARQTCFFVQLAQTIMTEFGQTDKSLKTDTKFKISVTQRLMSWSHRVRNSVTYNICNSAGSNNTCPEPETDI